MLLETMKIINTNYEENQNKYKYFYLKSEWRYVPNIDEFEKIIIKVSFWIRQVNIH